MWPFKKKEGRVLGHFHDYEEIGRDEHYLWCACYGNEDDGWWEHLTDPPKEIPSSRHMNFHFARQRVCLTCGHCKDEIKEAKDYFKQKEKRAQDRQELARKIWAHCKDTETK